MAAAKRDDTKANGLSRRERQIMDVVYRRGRATAAEVMEEMPDPPSYSAVRVMLRVLEEKGESAAVRGMLVPSWSWLWALWAGGCLAVLAGPIAGRITLRRWARRAELIDSADWARAAG